MRLRHSGGKWIRYDNRVKGTALLLICDWNFGCWPYEAQKPPSGLEDEFVVIFRWKERILCWTPWKELVSVLTCSECWSYIHENIYVICARKHVTFLDAVYKNFAFFSVIWFESILCTACSFFILHTHFCSSLNWYLVVFIVFIDCHCNSDHAHYRICLRFLSLYAFWLIHQAYLHICALSKYSPSFLIAF